MQNIKDQARLIRTSFSIRRGVLFRLDEVGRVIKSRTGLDVARSKLIAVAANLFYDVIDGIDFDRICDEESLQRELTQAIYRKMQRERHEE